MKKILVVEDDTATLDIMEFILQDAGYAVIKVNREVSIKEMAAIKPQLIILDFLLPFVLGTQLCSEIKEDPRTMHIPVILYSAHSGLEKLARDCRANAFLSKPFDIVELIKLVAKLVV